MPAGAPGAYWPSLRRPRSAISLVDELVRMRRDGLASMRSASPASWMALPSSAAGCLKIIWQTFPRPIQRASSHAARIR